MNFKQYCLGILFLAAILVSAENPAEAVDDELADPRAKRDTAEDEKELATLLDAEGDDEDDSYSDVEEFDPAQYDPQLRTGCRYWCRICRTFRCRMLCLRLCKLSDPKEILSDPQWGWRWGRRWGWGGWGRPWGWGRRWGWGGWGRPWGWGRRWGWGGWGRRWGWGWRRRWF